ncbi:hypothetical protein V6N11_065022 [Hibiscus sabdariffa]|uniref:Uncharacterized protein n=1 Tax=Hibiscus sabdariffa TaxID=183260 RepID=A0ABR2SIL7_9ROSI
MRLGSGLGSYQAYTTIHWPGSTVPKCMGFTLQLGFPKTHQTAAPRSEATSTAVTMTTHKQQQRFTHHHAQIQSKNNHKIDSNQRGDSRRLTHSGSKNRRWSTQ